MITKTDFIYKGSEAYQGGTLLHLLTREKEKPVYMRLGGDFPEGLEEGDACWAEVGGDCDDLAFVGGEDDGHYTFRAISEPISIGKKTGRPTPKVYFDGRIVDFAYKPIDDVNKMNYLLQVQTDDMNIWVMTHYEGQIELDQRVCGTASLHGGLHPGTEEYEGFDESDDGEEPNYPLFLAMQDGETQVQLDLSLFPAKYINKVGFYFEKGTHGFQMDHKAAMRCYTEAAKHGNGAAINNLGWMYLRGCGTDRDEHLASDLFHEAARLGNTAAMVNLGNLHEDHERYAAARYWYDAAWKAGDQDGALHYANLLYHGWGSERDYAGAYRIFRELYEDDYKTVTCFYLGLYAEKGLLGEPDYDAAIRYYTEGAYLGDWDCCTNLGGMYAENGPLETDMENAFAWYKRGAELGDALAMTNLGCMYEQGTLVSRDLTRAVRWFRRAAALGEVHAKEALERLGEVYEAKEEM